jgi:hypothetical protein
MIDASGTPNPGPFPFYPVPFNLTPLICRIAAMLKHWIDEIRYHRSKNKIKFQPAFLIGCGRSGTTILGTTLGKHKSIAYLNERRDLWHLAYPDFDIWTGQSSAPKLIATEADHDEIKTELLEKIFHKEQVLNNGCVLLEKLPINNFRLDFINKAFPNAKYIYLHRNGVEVARSIEKETLTRKWFGQNCMKWKLLNELSNELDLSDRDFSNYEKALLEWRYSLQFSEAFFSKISSENYYTLSYQTFLENPKLQVENIYTFLNLKSPKSFTNKITRDIKRQSEPVSKLEEREIELGGANLKLSVENRLRQSAPESEYKR